jgi:hypothetical protein
MSLGLRLLAKLPAPALEPQELMSQIANWIQHKCSDMLPKTRQGTVEFSPTIFCQLHPAAEEVELSLIDPEHLVVSANTSTVGPGYHIFLTSLLQDWARDFQAAWERPEDSSEDYCDETEYFFTGDEKQLFDNMTRWLKAVANSFFDGSLDADADDHGIALCMPMDPQFEADQLAITPLGPRAREWLYETAQDGNKGKDFFAWWTPGINAEYYLGRALAQMWSTVRWRSPLNDLERDLLKGVAGSLRTAYKLNPTLQYPWTEWEEILELIDAEPAEKESVLLHAKGRPSIGYRRRNVTVALPGGWRMRIPGSFSDFESDQDNDLCALDGPREIWFTSYRFTADSPREAFESMRREMKENRAEYLREGQDYIARATITKKRRDTGEDYFVLNSSNVCPAKRAVCTILFSEIAQKEWALDIWRSIQPTSAPEPNLPSSG